MTLVSFSKDGLTIRLTDCIEREPGGRASVVQFSFGSTGLSQAETLVDGMICLGE
jgi:hypothetical protein